MNPEINLLKVPSEAIGYGRLGVNLARELTRLGVGVYDHLPDPHDTAPHPALEHLGLLNSGNQSKVCNVVCWVSVPSHARNWWKGQIPILFSMWEATTLPPSFREALHEFDTIIVPSLQNVELFSGYHDNVQLCLLGVDPDVWHYTPRRPPGAFFDFLIAGSGARKGTDLAHAAFRKLWGRPGSWPAGGPAPRLIMKNPRGEAFHGERVEVISGRIPPDAEVALYETAHCYVQPCFSEDTLAVTPSGFKHYTELAVGEPIMTFSPETNRLETQPIRRIHRSHYRGKMVRIANKQLDLLVTPNHRIYYQGFSSGGGRVREWRVREAEKFVGMSTRYHLPVAWEPGNAESADPFLADLGFVVGWYLAEGSTDLQRGSYRVSFSNGDLTEIERLREVLLRLGIPSSLYTDDRRARPCYKVTVGSRKWLWSLLRDTAGQYQKDRHVPGWLLECPTPVLARCYEAMMIGDGSRKGNHVHYHTSSGQLTETFVLLCMKLGYGTKVWRREQPERHIDDRMLAPCSNWMIAIHEQHHEGTIKTRQHVSEETYDGEVWCVETDNATVITTRNGLTCGSGNSRGEGFGLQPLQAMAQGIPTILTDAHGHESFAHLGYGIRSTMAQSAYFIYGDAGEWWEPNLDDLCDRMRWVYDNWDAACGHAAHAAAAIATDWTWERTARSFVDIIGAERLSVPATVGEWYTPTLAQFRVITNRDWSCEIAGASYQFLKGSPTWVPADVKRILYEANLLDPACLEGADIGLLPEQLARLPEYLERHSSCQLCGQELGSRPTRADRIYETLIGTPS